MQKTELIPTLHKEPFQSYPSSSDNSSDEDVLNDLQVNDADGPDVELASPLAGVNIEVSCQDEVFLFFRTKTKKIFPLGYSKIW